MTDKVSSVTGGRSVTGVRRGENLGGGAVWELLRVNIWYAPYVAQG